MNPNQKTSNGFSLNGPVAPFPKNSAVPGILDKFKSPSPVSSALNKMQTGGATFQPIAKPTGPTVTNPVQGMGGSAQQKTSGLLGGADPTVSSRTEVNPAGTTVTEKYFDPNKGAGAAGGATGSATGGSTAGATQDPNATKRADLEARIAEAQKELEAKQAEQKTAADAKAKADKTTYQGLIGQGQGLYGQLPGLGQKAADIAAKAQQEYADIGKRAAGAGAGYSTTGTTPVAEGNAAVIARTAAAQQGAVTQGAQLGLTGLQQQAGNITSAAAGQAGLAGLTPEILRYGGANGGPMTAEEATVYKAKLDALGQGTGAAAIDTQAINGAESGISSITDLIKKGNLNPSNVNILNEGIQAIQKNLSNADYQTLLNSLEAINSALTKVTGTPVDIATLSTTQGTSLLATINNQVQIAKAFAAGKAKAQGAQGNDPLGLGI